MVEEKRKNKVPSQIHSKYINIIKKNNKRADMKRLVFKEPQVNMDYLSDDINKLQSEFNKRGYEISRADVYKVWTAYSDDYAAGWLGVPDDDCKFAAFDDWDQLITYLIDNFCVEEVGSS